MANHETDTEQDHEALVSVSYLLFALLSMARTTENVSETDTPGVLTFDIYGRPWKLTIERGT